MAVFPTESRVEPARSITLPGIRQEAKQYLEQHGCTIAEERGLVFIIYPEGTTKREIYPRTLYMRGIEFSCLMGQNFGKPMHYLERERAACIC